ncbi:hypothetical protein PV04_06996 [Phialophora macrospora]|uniref:Uncharacterized protein n=1 Tax=Phialophora macrospora TaxID=1851006 RepID=A0A0D2CRH9_9EURO|nr:hypothetical protein PV04_06996 [Phialophora macrospora]
MGSWDAIAAAVSGVNPAAYGTQGGRMYRPAGKPSEQTDDTLVTVPVLDLKSLQWSEGRLGASSFDTLTPETEATRQREKGKGLLSFFRRRSSTFDSPSERRVNIDMRQISRREYLKHYAKDEHGGYIGTDDPAEDCILNEEDLARWRGTAVIQAPLSIPFTGVGFETVKDLWSLTSKSTRSGAAGSATADKDATTGRRKTKFDLFKSFRGEGTIR